MKAYILSVVLLLLSTAIAWAEPATSSSSISVANLVRKSMTRLALDTQRVPAPYRPAAAETLALGIELPRFDINTVPGQFRTPETLGPAVTAWVDSIKLARAQEQAAWDARFKDPSVTAELLRQILRSIYIYRATIPAFHLQRVQQISQQDRTSWAWKAALSAKVEFWHVNPHTGSPTLQYAIRVDADASASEAIFGREGARDQAATSALNKLQRSLETRVRNLPAFKLSANITRATWNKAWFRVQQRDGAIPDSYYRVLEYMADDTRLDRGWIKLRHVADGRTTFESRAQVLSVRGGWRLEGGELLEEYNQLGLAVDAYGIYETMQFDGGTRAAAYQTDFAAGGGLAIHYDLARASGIPELLIGARIGATAPDGAIALQVEPEIRYRWYVRRLTGSFAAAAGYRRLLFQHQGTQWNMHSFGVAPSASLGIWITPWLELWAEAGYKYYKKATEAWDNDGTTGVFPGLVYDPTGLAARGGLRFSY